MALDGNPVFHHKSYFEFCITTCPNLKHLDLRKITPEMRENNGSGEKKMISYSKEENSNAGYANIANVSTDISPDKNQLSPNPTANNTDDISPENLLEVISQEWKNEMERIKQLGLNGYKRRKESRNECLVQSGHAEIEGDTMLFIYGNALEVLNNPDFQKTVEQISFQYVRFDNIVSHSNLSKMRRFTKLKKLVFSDNNIHSFIQISKLEVLTSLISLTIENNEVANTALVRTFIVYRFPNVTEINGQPVTDSDRLKARQQF